MHWKVGVKTVKTLKLEKGGGCMTPPPSSYGGAASEDRVCVAADAVDGL